MLDRDPKDLLGGIFIVALGVYVLATALTLGLGTPLRMGAGFFPAALGVAAIALGLVIIVSGIIGRGTLPRVAWKPFLAVIAGLLSFYLLVERAGLIPAIAALIALSGLADEQLRLRDHLALIVVASLLGWLVFSVLLGLPIPGIRGWV